MKPRHHLRSLGLCPLLLAGAGSLAAAQGPELRLPSLEDLLATKVELASGHTQAMLDSPQAVEVLTGDTLRRMGIRRLTDALRLMTSVEVVEAGGVASSLSIRSMLPAGIGQLVQILVDGVPMHNSSRFYPFDLDLLPVPVELIERIEVVRGPSSSLYGTNAVAGVVAITTRRPEAPCSGMAGGSLAARNVARGEGALFLQRGGLTFSAGGETASVGDSGQRPYRFLGGGAATSYQPGNDGSHAAKAYAQMRWEGSRVEAWGSVGMARKRIGEDLATAFALDPARQSMRETLVQAGLRGAAGALGTLQLQVARTAETLSASAVPALAAQDPGFLLDDHDYGRVTSDTVEVKDTLVAAGVTLVLGADANRLATPDSPAYGLGATTLYRRGAYANLTWPVTAALTLGAGARYERGDLGGGDWAPRATAVWTLGSETSLRAGYFSASRSPSLQEARTEVPALLILASPGLKPEHVRSWEAGLRKGMGAFDLELGIYAMDYRDGIAYLQTAQGGRQYQNRAWGSNRGAEGSVRWRPAGGVTLGANLNWTRFQLEGTGTPTTYAPRLKANAWIQGARGPWQWSLSLQHVGGTLINGFLITAPGGLSLEERPAFTQVHASGSVELTRGVRLELYVRNGAREATEQGVGGAVTTVLLQSMRREAGLHLAYRW
jgi:outer membrane receptor protein involved in Fe transport